MTEHELNTKIRQAFSHAAPDVLEAVLSDCEEQRGSVIVMTENQKKNPWTRRFAGIAACLILLLGGAFGLQTYQINSAVDSTVSIDVNPSVEIQVNRKERVLKIVPLNEDGKTIVGDMDFSGSDLKVAVNALIGSMLQNGYLNELANSILISVDSNDPVRGIELQERLTAEVSTLLQTGAFHGAVLSQTIVRDDSLQQLAQSYGITQGKAQLIQEILESNPLHTFEELTSLSINELNLLISAGQSAAAHVESVGTASDKAYIGEAKAREIALLHAGVSENALTGYEIELDTSWGVMVYDVEFKASGYEYDYEINAVDGSIVKSKKELDDDYVRPQTGQNSTASNNSGTATGTIISEASAKETALDHAGVSAEDIRGYESKLDKDDGITAYEIEFKANGYEYEYKINAVTGAVIKSEKERNGNSYSQSGQSSAVSSNSEAANGSTISEAKAKEIALAHAGVAASEISKYKADMDTDHGITVYELEFKAGGYEYEYEIHAATGEIIKVDKEWDD